MEKCDPEYPATRPITKDDLKDFRYDAKHKCDGCDTVGSYRTCDFWLCEKEMLEMCHVEIE